MTAEDKDDRAGREAASWGAVDLHSHVLPGLDDGAADVREAVQMCEDAIAAGTSVLAGTPHVRHDYRTSPEAMLRALETLRHAVRTLPIEIVGGGEVALEQLRLADAELRRFGLGGNPDYLLVEMPYYGWPVQLAAALETLRRRGIVPVLAHPERNPTVQESPLKLAPLVGDGVLVQLTAASIDGRLGFRAEATARILLRERLAHFVASDAHGPAIRQIGMADAVTALGDEALARWLMADLPGAIVAGAPLPPRPHTRRRLFPRLPR